LIKPGGLDSSNMVLKSVSTVEKFLTFVKRVYLKIISMQTSRPISLGQDILIYRGFWHVQTQKVLTILTENLDLTKYWLKKSQPRLSTNTSRVMKILTVIKSLSWHIEKSWSQTRVSFYWKFGLLWKRIFFETNVRVLLKCFTSRIRH
jgi:hypothetical protein